MKFFVTGASGQLGYDIIRELKNRYGEDIEILAPSSSTVDITDKESVMNAITAFNPDVVFHCAAYTAVDAAEEDLENCYRINVNGTENILEATKRVGAKLIYVSTDYVFDGTKEGYYKETDRPNPISIYGKTKLIGEDVVRDYPKHFIARTSWVFGINGKNFVKTMLRLAETKNEIGVVCDQFGSPTYTVDLARLLVDMSETEKYGTYHTNNSGYTSWNEFAKYIFEINGIEMKVNDVLTKDYKTAAARPLNSKLDRTKLSDNGFELLPDWQDALVRYNRELKREQSDIKVLERRKK